VYFQPNILSPKISLIVNALQCLFALSVPKGIEREKKPEIVDMVMIKFGLTILTMKIL
jgi:hypothetical protein